MQIHQLTIPDALIEWGKQPDVAVRFHRPWAHEVERMVEEGGDEPLRGRQTERLLARLEALCNEAIRHDRGELLLGFDLFTAEWLGLVFSWPKPDGGVESIGRNKRWDYQEARALIACPTAVERLPFCERAKDLISEVFPRARIGAIIGPDPEPEQCAGCGAEDVAVMFTLESDSDYCGKCYRDLTGAMPVIDKKPKKRGKRGRR